MPASAAAWARRIPASSAADFVPAPGRDRRWSGWMTMPSARSRSATATGSSGSAIASRMPIAAAAREASSRSISW